ncbi:MAG: pilus assembly protein PilM, partial [Acidobacteriota bacterium]
EKTLDYFKTTTFAEEIQQMFLCGGASRTKGLQEALGEKFQFPVELLDPFKRITGLTSLGMDEDSESAQTDYAIAVGLALRTA